jgi:hypothetical protein
VRVAERKEQRELEEADRTAVEWRLDRHGAHTAETVTLRLTNAGKRAALDVHVDLPSHFQVVGASEPRGHTIAAGSAVVFEVAPPRRDVGGSEVAVRWRVHSDGPEYTFRQQWADLS